MDSFEVLGPGARQTIRSLKADNALFSRDNARFLRRLLHIASKKQDTWWYIQHVLEDSSGRGLLEKHLPQAELSKLHVLCRSAAVQNKCRLRKAAAAKQANAQQHSVRSRRSSLDSVPKSFDYSLTTRTTPTLSSVSPRAPPP
eukprot:Hpha_TRINITY_DN29082_c0_g1::TRINITY_DN29082_c0_g1_i1::g.156553::m.156553